MAKKKTPKKKLKKKTAKGKPSKPVTFHSLRVRLKKLLDSIPKREAESESDPRFVGTDVSFRLWNDSNSLLRKKSKTKKSLAKKKWDDVDRFHDIQSAAKKLINKLPTAEAMEALDRLRDLRKKHFGVDQDNIEFDVDEVVKALPKADPQDIEWTPNRYRAYDDFAKALSGLLLDLSMMHPNVRLGRKAVPAPTKGPKTAQKSVASELKQGDKAMLAIAKEKGWKLSGMPDRLKKIVNCLIEEEGGWVYATETIKLFSSKHYASTILAQVPEPWAEMVEKWIEYDKEFKRLRWIGPIEGFASK